jgi:hypothetical protein
MIEMRLDGVDPIDLDLREYPKGVTRVMVRALNRGIASANTFMGRAIAGDTGLKVGDIKKALTLRKATWSVPEARLATSLKRIPLIDFGAKGPEPSRGRGRGVSYRLQGARGRHSSAFIATMGSGHRGVFARRLRARLPIKELFGPSLGHVFAKFRPEGLRLALDTFHKNFDHEIDFAASRNATGTD